MPAVRTIKSSQERKRGKEEGEAREKGRQQVQKLVREAQEEKKETVEVKHWVYEPRKFKAGTKIKEIHKKLKSLWKLTKRPRVRVNAQRVGMEYVTKEGDMVEFVKKSARKG